MRDGTILDGFNRMSDAISADQAQLQKATALLRTRVDAIESLMLGSRFGLIKLIFLQMISPVLLARAVQRAHAEQIRRFNLMREAISADKPKVKAPPTPILTKVH